jgi:hypothetical protein
MKHVLADNGVLNMGGGVVFQIPLWYDDLAKTGVVPRCVRHVGHLVCLPLSKHPYVLLGVTILSVPAKLILNLSSDFVT